MNQILSDDRGSAWPTKAALVLLLIALFAIPAVIVRTSMENVPGRAQYKVLANYQEAIDIVTNNFARHSQTHIGRLGKLPGDSISWIELINPMRRRAPGGGPAIKETADLQTGAIGIKGDSQMVLVSLPDYLDLKADKRTIYLTLSAE